jgi:hypothetical protein
MDTPNLVATLASLQTELRQDALPLCYHRIGRVDVIVYPQGIQGLDEEGLAITSRPVGLELAAALIETS